MVGREVGEVWPKVAAKLIQLFAVYGSTRAAFAPPEAKPEWEGATYAGVVCLIVWEVLSLLIDGRVKAADKADKTTLSKLEAESRARTQLMALFRELTSEKTKSLVRLMRRRGRRLSPSGLRNALTPEAYLDDALHSLCKFFAAAGPAIPNFRAVLYAEVAGALEVQAEYDLSEPGQPTVASFRSNPEAFRTDQEENPSHAVRCVTGGETLVVEDCAAAALAGEFRFFNDHQRRYLRSMVAHPLGIVCLADGSMTRAAVVVDTNEPGFFRESDRDSLTFAWQEFAARIKLEMLLRATLLSRGDGR